MIIHTARLRPSPAHMLWQTALGAMPGFLDDSASAVGWVRMSHRGVQFLDRLVIPRKQRPYVFAPHWDIRIDTAFGEVVRACADSGRATIQKGAGRTWITEPLIRGLLTLHARGFAHSYEAWRDGQLAGGLWGFQLGRYVSMNSMFYRVPNASKAAFARGQLLLKERGFTAVDMGAVPEHLVNFGIEWVPRGRFEAMLDEWVCAESIAVSDDRPAPKVPWWIRQGVPWARRWERVRRTLRRHAADGPHPNPLPQAGEGTRDAGEPNSAAGDRAECRQVTPPPYA